MMLHAAFQNVATNEAAVDHTIAASGIARTSLGLAGVSALLLVLRAGAFVLLPTSA